MAKRKSRKDRWSSAVPNREEQFKLKRLALIREAGRAFARKGFHNTSLDEVANALNVTKPALYYYIRTKQEILFECHNLALDIGQRAKEIAFTATEDPHERLRLFLRTYIAMVTSELGSYAVLAEPVSSLDPEQQEHIIKRRREFDRIFRSLVAESIELGKIPPCNPKLAVAFFMGAVNTISRWFDPDGDCSSEEIADTYIRFIMDGLNGAAPVDARPNND